MRTKFITYEQGFTLAEAVIVIVISGIIFGIVAMFIRLPVKGYVDTQARAELTDIADTALRRMARDIRLALPNSVRVTTAGNRQYVEFLLTKTGARYLAEEDEPNPGRPFLRFAQAVNCATNESDCQFEVVGPMPSEAQTIVPNDFIVVYNLGPEQDPANAYSNCTTPCNRARVAKVDGAIITIAANPFAIQDNGGFRSPGRHFHVVTTPVTYECDPNTGQLRRYWDYQISANQPSSPDSAPLGEALGKALLATNVQRCAFSYNNIASQRTGLVGIGLTLGAAGSNTHEVSLFNQVHVDNTP
ncbi:MAG TPA: prepilin-type N-terminal cleavage/methylation domain-containing protein [Noviherbaspirillum sp.]|jgi:MSHA biogenesis protein MshO|uniref:prepilin-type N-terminal cleavage/methylation domain-containing protein n=1 Tax=Noviherbaspirillum sp. TaxID=1926288 RepID=UPI002DDD03F8|nr:prepilin-type N-terminal cleavage/methylation domain-containing protein [Noviherbaspirillum sp.]HEV2610302.1 prepilin-type N-terminal cleavage/methylation domain-containing protein [Noviherbaspirillum sp.]